MTIKKQKANNLLLSISGVLIGFSILILLVWFGMKLGLFDNGDFGYQKWRIRNDALNDFNSIKNNLDSLIWDLESHEVTDIIPEHLRALNEILNNNSSNNHKSVWGFINQLDSSINNQLRWISDSWYELLNTNKELMADNNVDKYLELLKEIKNNLGNLKMEDNFILYNTLLNWSPIVYFLGVTLAIFNFSMRSKSSENVKTSNVVWTINLIGVLIIALFGVAMIIYWISLNVLNTWNVFDIRNLIEVNIGFFVGIMLLVMTITLWTPYLSIYKQKSELIENVAPLNTNLGAVNNNNVVIEQPVNISTNPVESSEVVETTGEDAKWTVGKKLVFAGSITTIVLAAISLITISIISLPLLIIYFIPGMFMYPALIASLVLGIIILKSIKKNTNSNKLYLIAGIIIIATGFIGSIFIIMWYGALFGGFIPPMVIGGVLILVGSLIKN